MKSPLEFGRNYKIIAPVNGDPKCCIKHDRTYLAKLESAQGVYYCFGAVTQREHQLPQVHNSELTGEYHRFPNLVVIEGLREGDFTVKGLEVVIKPKLKHIGKPMIVRFEAWDNDLVNNNVNAWMCKRLMSILDKK